MEYIALTLLCFDSTTITTTPTVRASLSRGSAEPPKESSTSPATAEDGPQATQRCDDRDQARGNGLGKSLTNAFFKTLISKSVDMESEFDISNQDGSSKPSSQGDLVPPPPTIGTNKSLARLSV